MDSETAEACRQEDGNAVPGRLPRPSLDPVYEFNAPQFHDFTNARDDPVAAESYFEDGRRKTICKPRMKLGELAPVAETSSCSEEGHIAVNNPTESALCAKTNTVQVAPKDNNVSAPVSPGLRIPTHSVLDTERLGMLSTSQPGNEIPGFMRGRKSGLVKDKPNQQQSGTVKSKSKKCIKTVIPPDGKFGLAGPRHPPPKSSEELELEKIRKDMQAAAVLRERNKARMLEASKSEPIISVSKRTIQSSGSKRVSSPQNVSRHGESSNSSKPSQEKQVSGGVRGRSRTRSDKVKTQNQNYGFAGPRSRSRSLSVNNLEQAYTESSQDSAPFTPLTVQTNSFFAKRSESKSSEQTFPARTLPQEFHLSTPRRSTKILSSEEKELLEIKQHAQFKARKMPKKILHSTGDVGVPRIHKKSPTVAEEFSFATTKRSNHSRASIVGLSEKEEFHQFKARPVPQSVLTPRRPQTAPARNTTIPKSPRISKPKSRPMSPVKKEIATVFHARPMPDFSRTPQVS